MTKADTPTIPEAEFELLAGAQNIYQRLASILDAVPPIEKDQVQNYKAFAVDRVYSTLRPLFAKHHVIVVPSVIDVQYIWSERQDDNGRPKSPAIDARVVIEYSFYAPDGSSVTMTFAAEGRDFGDKATNKAVQQAFKYGLIQMFMISTGEVDPDAENPIIEGGRETQEIVTTEPVDEPPKLSAAEKRMKAIKDAAWQHTDVDMKTDARIAEAQLIVEQAIAQFGGAPKNATEVQAIVANIDEMFSA